MARFLPDIVDERVNLKQHGAILEIAPCCLTSYRSIRDDLLAANAEWLDEPVVIDRNLITSRTPRDLP